MLVTRNREITTVCRKYENAKKNSENTENERELVKNNVFLKILIKTIEMEVQIK